MLGMDGCGHGGDKDGVLLLVEFVVASCSLQGIPDNSKLFTTEDSIYT